MSLCLALLLGCSGGADLIEPGSGVPVYQLRDVDGESLPVITDSTATFEGMVYFGIEDAEMALLGDSVAELVILVRTRSPDANSVGRRELTGRYWIAGDTVLFWCPAYSQTGMDCASGRYQPDEFVVRRLDRVGRLRDHRFTPR